MVSLASLAAAGLLPATGEADIGLGASMPELEPEADSLSDLAFDLELAAQAVAFF